MSLTKKETFKYLKYLNTYKGLLGFEGWNVKLGTDWKDMDIIAEVWVDPLEKEIKIQLYAGFKEFDEERKKNVLFHELVHGRVILYRKMCAEYSAFLEEDMVNDITRGFEQIANFKL